MRACPSQEIPVYTAAHMFAAMAVTSAVRGFLQRAQTKDALEELRTHASLTPMRGHGKHRNEEHGEAGDSGTQGNMVHGAHATV